MQMTDSVADENGSFLKYRF